MKISTRPFTFFYRLMLSVLAVIAVVSNATAQCSLTITNLPDTIVACKNTTLQLDAGVVSNGGSVVSLDTIWSPVAGLSDTNVLNPVVTLGTASVQYTLSVTSITPSNHVDNGDFESGNTGFTSDYTFATGPNSLVPEGLYSTTTNPNLVHSSFLSFGDHTTGTGNMMVINGANAPVDIWCQTINVTPNTDYDFSAYGASCTGSNPAQLQFEINGVLLGSPLQLPSITGQWTEFHTVWNSGSNTSITICIYDQQTAADGNDFAIDDITFRQICSVKDSVYIKVRNLDPAIDKVVKLGCAADTVDFTAINNGDTPDQYKWDFGDGTVSTLQNPQHIYTAQGVYNVKLTTKLNGCGDSASTTIDTRHPLSIDFTTDKDSICATQSIHFTSNDQGTTTLTYYWNFGDGTTDNTANPPDHQYNTPGIYTVTHVVTDQVPCSDTLTKQIVVLEHPFINMGVSDSIFCVGQQPVFHGELFAGYDNALWDFGDGSFIVNQMPTVNHGFDKPGDYVVTLTGTYRQCPAVSMSQGIHVLALPHVDLGTDTSMCPYASPIPLANHYFNLDNVKYLWNTGDSSASIFATMPGLYWLQLTNPGGCSATDSIDVLKSCYMDIPNAFTPNDDGVNDYFFPRQFLTKELLKFHMEVYDRWGEIVFQTDNTNGRGWDGKFNGKDQPEGVYIYLIDAVINGMPEEKVKGNVTLLR